MSDMIDRAQLIRDLEQHRATHSDDLENEYFEGVDYGLSLAQSIARDQPSAQNPQRPVSRWVKNEEKQHFFYDQYRCEACRNSVMSPKKFCDQCGAEMKTEEETAHAEKA